MTASLDRHANNVSPPSDKDFEGFKKRRHRLRRMAGKILPWQRVSCCGQRPTGQAVTIHQAETGHHFGGLETCGSIWVCPVCAAKISEGRKEEIEHVMADHRAAGGTAYMATLTIPHMTMQTCKELKEVVSNVWRTIKMGAPWYRAKDKYGYLGDIRALEITHGANGWHPHIHVLIFFHPGVAPHQTEGFSRWLFDRWARGVEECGYGACSTNAFKFDLATDDNGAADYVVKWGAAMELTKANTKISKTGRSPWQILADCKSPKGRDAALFREYAKALLGARQITWAGDIRYAYRPREEKTDAELAETPASAQTHVATVEKPVWDLVAKRHLTAPILIAADKGGLPSVADLLKAHGIETQATIGHSLEEGRAVPWLKLADPPRQRSKNDPPGPVPEGSSGSPRGHPQPQKPDGFGDSGDKPGIRDIRPQANTLKKELSS